MIFSTSMLAWIIYLRFALPHSYMAQNWRLAWIGFDSFLFISLISTYLSESRKSIKKIPFAITSATLLVIDAWFDVITSRAGGDRDLAILLALTIEIPLAIVLSIYAKKSVEKAISENKEK